MLYLMRKIGQSIIVNNNIEIKVESIKGKSVKLGFDFPKEATVLRKEVHDTIMQENIAASSEIELGDDFTLDLDLGIKSDKPE